VHRARSDPIKPCAISNTTARRELGELEESLYRGDMYRFTVQAVKRAVYAA